MQTFSSSLFLCLSASVGPAIDIDSVTPYCFAAEALRPSDLTIPDPRTSTYDPKIVKNPRSRTRKETGRIIETLDSKKQRKIRYRKLKTPEFESIQGRNLESENQITMRKHKGKRNKFSATK